MRNTLKNKKKVLKIFETSLKKMKTATHTNYSFCDIILILYLQNILFAVNVLTPPVLKILMPSLFLEGTQLIVSIGCI